MASIPFSSMPGEHREPSTPQFNNALDEFRAQLAVCTRDSAIDRRPFILTRRLAKWFRDSPAHGAPLKESNAARLLRLVSVRPPVVSELLGHMEDTDGLCRLRVFAILLQLDLEALDTHLTRARMLGRLSDAGILDRKLPMDEGYLYERIRALGIDEKDAKDFAGSFWRHQWAFCASAAFDDSYNTTHGSGEMILPICTMEPVKLDGPKRVFHIEVPVECVPDSLAHKITAKPHRRESPAGEVSREKYI